MQLQVIIVFTVQILVQFPAHEMESWECDHPDWLAEQVDGSFELLETTKETQPLEEVLVGLFPGDPPKHLTMRIFPFTHYAQQQKWWYGLNNQDNKTMLKLLLF